MFELIIMTIDFNSQLISTVCKRVRSEFKLDWRGIHGAPHWSRVMHHGLDLANETGADPLVIKLFALIHDSCRYDEGDDKNHGNRAADFATRMFNQGILHLSREQLEHLVNACQGHSKGLLAAHPTVQTCWDADRLDLGRIGVRPDPRYLCTVQARCPQRIQRAWQWSRGEALFNLNHLT